MTEFNTQKHKNTNNNNKQTYQRGKEGIYGFAEININIFASFFLLLKDPVKV